MTLSISELLFEKYMEYQGRAGTRKTLKQFAKYIGLGQVYLNRLMNNRRNAGEKTVEYLADFFSDMRFYDAAGLLRPDPELKYITRHWEDVPKTVRHKIAERVAEYTVEKIPSSDQMSQDKECKIN